jgi:hypothetical protein
VHRTGNRLALVETGDDNADIGCDFHKSILLCCWDLRWLLIVAMEAQERD